MLISKNRMTNFLYRLDEIGESSSYMQKNTRDPDLLKLLEKIDTAGKNPNIKTNELFKRCESEYQFYAPVVTLDVFQMDDSYEQNIRNYGAETYTHQTYIRELKERHKAKTVKHKATLYYSDSDLFKQLATAKEKHVDHSPHYMYVNLSQVKEEKMQEYMDSVVAAVQPQQEIHHVYPEENFLKKAKQVLYPDVYLRGCHVDKDIVKEFSKSHFTLDLA